MRGGLCPSSMWIWNNTYTPSSVTSKIMFTPALAWTTQELLLCTTAQRLLNTHSCNTTPYPTFPKNKKLGLLESEISQFLICLSKYLVCSDCSSIKCLGSQDNKGFSVFITVFHGKQAYTIFQDKKKFYRILQYVPTISACSTQVLK